MIEMALTGKGAEAIHQSLASAKFHPSISVIVLAGGAVAIVLADNSVIPLLPDHLDEIHRRSCAMRYGIWRSFMRRLKSLVSG